MLNGWLFLLVVALAAATQIEKSKTLMEILKNNPSFATSAPRPSPMIDSAGQNTLSPKLQSTLMVDEKAVDDPPKKPAKTAVTTAKKDEKKEKKEEKPKNANAPSPAPRPTYAPQCEDYHNICGYRGIYSCCPGQKGLKARCDLKDCDPKRPLGAKCGGEWMAVMCPKTCALCRPNTGTLEGGAGGACAQPPCAAAVPATCEPPCNPAAPVQPAPQPQPIPQPCQPAGTPACANGSAGAVPNSAAVKLAAQIKAVARAAVAAEQAREAAKTASAAVEVVKKT